MTNCNLCSSPNSNHVFDYKYFQIVQCSDCELVYVQNPTIPSAAKQYYEQEYYSAKNGTTGASLYALGEEFRVREAKTRLKKLGKISSLLDVGCGLGFFVSAAAQKGIFTVGIDISENAVSYGQSRGWNIQQYDLLNFNEYDPNSFDAITFWASLEHLYDPKKTIEKAYTLLKPKGLLVIETGDIDSFQAKLSLRHWRLLEEDHNYYFSSKTLDTLLEKTGFDPFKTEYDGFVESVLAQLALKERILQNFSHDSLKSKRWKSQVKEWGNTLAGKIHLGDVMIKYARKS